MISLQCYYVIIILTQQSSSKLYYIKVVGLCELRNEKMYWVFEDDPVHSFISLSRLDCCVGVINPFIELSAIFSSANVLPLSCLLQ